MLKNDLLCSRTGKNGGGPWVTEPFPWKGL